MTPSSFIKDTIKSFIPNRLLIHRLPAKTGNCILLTFDDGPDEIITPIVLERLDKFNVKAVFFVIGEKVEKLPHIVKLIWDNGHIIGNHTYSHPYIQIPPIIQYQENIIRCQNIIENSTNTWPKLYRSPAGILSCSGLFLTAKLNLKTILWSIEGGEWGVHKHENAEIISQRLIKNLRSRDIVLLHDNNTKTPLILDRILPHLREQKFDLEHGVSFL